MSPPSNELRALTSELHDVSVQAQSLARMAQDLLGGSATGVDRTLIESLLSLARSMRSAADAMAALPKGS